jgi:hypothetical protein
VTNTVTTIRPVYYPKVKGAHSSDAELEPYASLFLKPLTHKKSEFSKKELEVMCKDPLHSPRLILYLINFVKGM